MCEARRIITDDIWERYEPHTPGRKPGQVGGSYPKYDNRTVLEAGFWIIRTGSPWRDLPKEFGNWNSIYRRFIRWFESGMFNEDWFIQLSQELGLDLSTVMVDGTFIPVHKHGTGALKADPGMTTEENREAQAIGPSRGGLTTKIVAMVDKAGKFAGFVLTPGNAYEAHSLPALLETAQGMVHEVIADKAYDDNATLDLVERKGAKSVIPSRSQRKEQRWCDPVVYGMRHFVENRFAALKEFRGIATRYHKRALIFGGFINLVALFVALRESVQRSPSGGTPVANRRMAL